MNGAALWQRVSGGRKDKEVVELRQEIIALKQELRVLRRESQELKDRLAAS